MEVSSLIPQKMFVMPVPRVSPQGRHNYSFVKSDGTQVPAGRTFARRAEKRYCFPLSSDGMKIDTGLDTMVDNPFASNDEFANKYIKDQWIDRKEMLTTKEQITLQTYLEVVHNRPPGTYTSEKKVRKALDTEATDNNFFENFSVALEDGTNVFTSDTIEGQLSMLLMKVSPSVAANKSVANPSLHDFYIGEEHEAVIEKTNRRKKQARAIARLQMIKDNFDDFTLYQVAIVLRLVKGKVNHNIVEKLLDDYLWDQTKDLEQKIDKFERLVKDIEKAENKQKLYLWYVFQQAINERVIGIVNGNYLWHTKKHIQNLYNLGTKQEAILSQFYTEMLAYNPDIEAENFYGDLLVELQNKGVKLIDK